MYQEFIVNNLLLYLHTRALTHVGNLKKTNCQEVQHASTIKALKQMLMTEKVIHSVLGTKDRKSCNSNHILFRNWITLGSTNNVQRSDTSMFGVPKGYLLAFKQHQKWLLDVRRRGNKPGKAGFEPKSLNLHSNALPLEPSQLSRQK